MEQMSSHNKQPEKRRVPKPATLAFAAGLFSADIAAADTSKEPESNNAVSVEQTAPKLDHMLLEIQEPQQMQEFITSREAERMGIDPIALGQSLEILLPFIAQAESKQDMKASNPDSSALSIFQILTADSEPEKQNGTMHTMINRLYNVLARTGARDEHSDFRLRWTRELYEDPTRILETSRAKQELLVLAMLFESPGTDDLFRKLTGPDQQTQREAALGLYYKYHTDPDDAVRTNAQKAADWFYISDDDKQLYASTD